MIIVRIYGEPTRYRTIQRAIYRWIDKRRNLKSDKATVIVGPDSDTVNWQRCAREQLSADLRSNFDVPLSGPVRMIQIQFLTRGSTANQPIMPIICGDKIGVSYPHKTTVSSYYPTTRPDYDNIVKLVQDCLFPRAIQSKNTAHARRMEKERDQYVYLLDDDSQIVDSIVLKRYAWTDYGFGYQPPGIAICIDELDEPPDKKDRMREYGVFCDNLRECATDQLSAMLVESRAQVEEYFIAMEGLLTDAIERQGQTGISGFAGAGRPAGNSALFTDNGSGDTLDSKRNH